MPIARNMNEILYKNPKSVISRVGTAVYPIGLMALLVVCVAYMASGTYNPFIYFNF